jgi:hypothetical protein
MYCCSSNSYSLVVKTENPFESPNTAPLAPFATFIVSICTKEERVGQIHAKPSAFFHDMFFKELRYFCFDLKQIFEYSLLKVVSSSTFIYFIF